MEKVQWNSIDKKQNGLKYSKNDKSSTLPQDLISKVFWIRDIMPHDLEILCDTIDMWSFQFRYWSTITPKNLTLVTLCIASLCKITSPWGFRFFHLDIIKKWVLFTLRVSLLESNHSATLANSELSIWIAPSIESCWTYTVVSSETRTNDKILLELTLSLMYIRNNNGPRIEPSGRPMFRLSKGERVWFQETKCSRSDR